jgi:glycosyltransferase involved in cell wall biosynthesis
MQPSRILFVTREAIVHQLGGSTTYALNLLELLTAHGSAVTLLATTVESRSPRLFFRPRTKLPEGVRLIAPGYVRVGRVYVNLFSSKAWARALLRLCTRWAWLAPAGRMISRHYGDALTGVAWDLSEPTAAERALVLRYAAMTHATTVVGNYAYFGALFDAPSLRAIPRVLIMHDLLSARVDRFVQAGLPLDCTPVTRAQELGWIDHATCALASQLREAEEVQPLVRARVLVAPMVWTPHARTKTPLVNRVLFVGSNIVPNQTGLRWFLDEVWPSVCAQRPDAELAVVGTVGASLEEPQRGVLKLGLVPSIDAEYARASVVVIPLRVGSGIKIKLIEALSFGKATVSTSIGVQGIEELAPGVIEVADDPADFAAAVVRLLGAPELRVQREIAALALMQQHFSAEQELPAEFAMQVFGA